MASGNKLLDENGNKLLQADGDSHKSDGAGDECCCEDGGGTPDPDCCDCVAPTNPEDSPNGCEFCCADPENETNWAKCTPETLDVVFSGVQVCDCKDATGVVGGSCFDHVKLSGTLDGSYTLEHVGCTWIFVVEDTWSAETHGNADCDDLIETWPSSVLQIELEKTDMDSWRLTVEVATFDALGNPGPIAGLFFGTVNLAHDCCAHAFSINNSHADSCDVSTNCVMASGGSASISE